MLGSLGFRSVWFLDFICSYLFFDTSPCPGLPCVSSLEWFLVLVFVKKKKNFFFPRAHLSSASIPTTLTGRTQTQTGLSSHHWRCTCCSNTLEECTAATRQTLLFKQHPSNLPIPKQKYISFGPTISNYKFDLSRWNKGNEANPSLTLTNLNANQKNCLFQYLKMNKYINIYNNIPNTPPPPNII